MLNEALIMGSDTPDAPPSSKLPSPAIAESAIITADPSAQESKGDGHSPESILTTAEQPLNTNWYQRYQEAMKIEAELAEKFRVLVISQKEKYQEVLEAILACRTTYEAANVDCNPEAFLTQINNEADSLTKEIEKYQQALQTSTPLSEGIKKVLSNPDTPAQLRNQLQALLQELNKKVEKELQTIEIFLDGQLALSRLILSEPIANSINGLLAHVAQILHMAQFPEGREILPDDVAKLCLIQEILDSNSPPEKLAEMLRAQKQQETEKGTTSLQNNLTGTPTTPIPNEPDTSIEVTTADFESEAVMRPLREHIATLSSERTEIVDRGKIKTVIKASIHNVSPETWGRVIFKKVGLDGNRGANITSGLVLKISPQEQFIIDWRLGKVQLPNRAESQDDKKKL